MTIESVYESLNLVLFQNLLTMVAPGQCAAAF